MQTTLNGGNFGGKPITVSDDTKLVIVQDADGGLWSYDPLRNADTATSEFVGMVQEGGPEATSLFTTRVSYADLPA